MEDCLRKILDNDALGIELSNEAYNKLMNDHTWDNNAHEIIETAGLS